MKKLVAFVLAAYFIAGGILLLLAEPAAATVRILSVERPYSFFVADGEETFPFLLGIDDPDAYVTDPAAILSASLSDAEDELALALLSIEDVGTDMVREGVAYHEFRYAFGLDGIALADGTVEFRDAFLNLTYENGTAGAYAIGDADVTFGVPGEPRHLDFTRLAAVFDVEDGREAVVGIVLGITAKTGSGVTITSVDLHCPGLAASLGDAIALAAVPEPGTPVADLLGLATWMLVAAPRGGSVAILDEALLFIPVVHPDGLTPATRFMVEIGYAYGGDEYRFMIDDFAFRTAFPNPETYGMEVHLYEHRR